MGTLAQGEPREATEAELTRLIEKRARTGDGDPEAKEALWLRSVERYNARRQDANRWEWVRFFDRMAANHSALANSYRERAERLCEEGAQG